MRNSRLITKFFGVSTAVAIIALGAAGTAWATPTQEEVFQSINQNVGSTVDVSKAVPFVLAAVGLVIMAVLFNSYRKRQTFPKRLNNPGKLNREMCKAINLKSVELKQLKILAADQQVEHPLTLILCPSLLGKAIRSPNVKVDRAVVRGLVGKLKESLGDR